MTAFFPVFGIIYSKISYFLAFLTGWLGNVFTELVGWLLCLCPYTGTSLVPYRKLPTTAITKQHEIFARFSLQ